MYILQTDHYVLCVCVCVCVLFAVDASFDPLASAVAFPVTFLFCLVGGGIIFLCLEKIKRLYKQRLLRRNNALVRARALAESINASSGTSDSLQQHSLAGMILSEQLEQETEIEASAPPSYLDVQKNQGHYIDVSPPPYPGH